MKSPNAGSSALSEPVHGELAELAQNVAMLRVDTIAAMRDFLILFVHLIVTVARLAGPGGLRSVVSTRAHWVLSVADSQRNRSQLRKLSFVWPRNVSQEGPPDPNSGQ